MIVVLKLILLDHNQLFRCFFFVCVRVFKLLSHHIHVLVYKETWEEIGATYFTCIGMIVNVFLTERADTALEL